MRKLVLALQQILLVVGLIFLNSCKQGGGSGGSSSATPGETPNLPSISLASDLVAFQGLMFSSSTISSSEQVDSISVSNGPSWLSYNAETEKLEGLPVGLDGIVSFNLTVEFSSGVTRELGPYSIDVKSDPLFANQWNLLNSGQTNFANNPGTSGFDINISEAYLEGVTGRSDVQIVVSDGRIDLQHEDLIENRDLSLSKNYSLPSPYFGNPSSSVDDYHGTAVSSLVAAKGWNGIGMRGVCPNCKLVGYNFLDYQDSAKLINQAASGSMSVYNYSYGFTTQSVRVADSGYLSQVKTSTLSGRAAKGIVFVTSAGNDFVGPGGVLPVQVYAGNSNLDQTKSYPYKIVVGATDAFGLPSSYSTPGSNIWVSAPGGGDYPSDPALIVADLEGCSIGRSKSSSTANEFESNLNGFNPNCKYSSIESGTSFAAPTVSGLVGLMLSVNPELSWRDIKWILAATSKIVYPNYGATSHPLGAGYDLTGHIYQQGWVTNAAGFSFHNRYGFGIIDAGAAVKMAKNFSVAIGELFITEDPRSGSSFYRKGNQNISIPDNSATGVSDSIYVRHNLITEAVQVTLSIQHPYSSELGVELISPSGTKSILMNINSGITNTSLNSVTFLSNAFLGESSLGNWTLKVIDSANLDTGTLTDWSIKVWGSKIASDSAIFPETPSNLTGLSYFANTASPRFYWNPSPSGDVIRYEYCVGVSQTDCSIYPWTGGSLTETAQLEGMTLTWGATYFFNLRAVNTLEKTSPIMSRSWIASDGGLIASTPTLNAPTAKVWPNVVSIGDLALIFNGFNGSSLTQTHRFSSTTNSFSVGTAAASSSSTVTSPYFAASSSEVFYWNSGINIYSVAGNSWSIGSATNRPFNDRSASVIWTGTQVVVWGGLYSNTGSRYTRSTNSWSAMTTTNAPIGRQNHSAVWTGAEMIVWGGKTSASVLTNTGARYNPATNTWTTMSTIGAPTARANAAAIWTGSELIVWGGSLSSDLVSSNSKTGAKYNPSTDTWTQMSTTAAPEDCSIDTNGYAWSGTKLLIANCSFQGYIGLYDLATDTWQRFYLPASVRASNGATVVWLQDRFLIWGGSVNSQYSNNGVTYVPYEE